jgi:hypothetical protein
MKLTVRQIVVAGLMGAIAILLGVTRLGFIGPFHRSCRSARRLCTCRRSSVVCWKDHSLG